MSLSPTATRLATLLLAALLLWAAPAGAAMPPLDVAQARQASLRGALKSGASVDISVTALGTKLQSFSASSLRLGASKKLELAASASDPEKKPSTLVIDANAPMPWSVVFSLLSAADPLASLQTTHGAIDAGQRKIDTLEDGFVYHYGASPQVVLSRDFSLMRRVLVHAQGVDWEFRLSGDLGVGGLPERVDILRAGAPFANMRLSLAGQSNSPKSKR